jgi:hypothetical protein
VECGTRVRREMRETIGVSRHPDMTYLRSTQGTRMFEINTSYKTRCAHAHQKPSRVSDIDSLNIRRLRSLTPSRCGSCNGDTGTTTRSTFPGVGYCALSRPTAHQIHCRTKQRYLMSVFYLVRSKLLSDLPRLKDTLFAVSASCFL